MPTLDLHVGDQIHVRYSHFIWTVVAEPYMGSTGVVWVKCRNCDGKRTGFPINEVLSIVQRKAER